MHDTTDGEPFDAEVISQGEWESQSSRLHRRVLGLRGAAVVLTVVTGFLVARFILLTSQADSMDALLVARTALIASVVSLGVMATLIAAMRSMARSQRDYLLQTDHLDGNQMAEFARLVESCPGVRDWMLRHRLSPEGIRVFQLEDAAEYAEAVGADARRAEAVARINEALNPESAAVPAQ